MKLFHVGVALLASVVVYLCGSLLFATYRQEAYRALELHLSRLEANVEQLREQHRRLAATAELYRRSPDAVALQARRLQYYQADETVIRAAGAAAPRVTQSPGTLVRRPDPPSDQLAYVRAAAIATFVLVLLAGTLYDARAVRSSGEMRRTSR